jgi:hypothetical protein
VYSNRTAGYIVNDLIAKYLAADGITVGTIDAGITIPRARFGYVQLSNVLRSLAEASGYIWYIDYDKALHFTERDLLSAPFEINSAVSGEKEIKDVRTDLSLTQYRNRQYISFNELTAVRSEQFTGDGARQTFTVEFPIALAPTVTVNSVAKTVGIARLEEGKQWYWSKGSNQITQDLLDAPLGTDGSLSFVQCLSNAQEFNFVSARGNYAIGAQVSNGIIQLFRINNESAEVAQILDTGYDQINGLTFITDSYFAVSYRDGGSDYIQLGKRVGSSIQLVGSPTSTSNRLRLSQECSNGQFFVSCLDSTADGLQLWSFDEDTETITLEETIVDVSGSSPEFVWYTDYVAATLTTNSVRVYKLDRSTSTLSEIYANNEGIGTQVQGAAWVDKYLYTGFSTTTALPLRKTIVRHSLNVSTDTVTRLGTQETVSIPNSSRIISINDFICVTPFSGNPHDIEYYQVNTADGSLVYFGRYNNSGQSTTIAFAVSRNIGNTFIFGCGANTNSRPLYIARQAPYILGVTYQGSFPNVIMVNDFDQQAERIIAEGGTGIYEAFQASSQTDGEAEAIDIAQAILNRYGRIPKVFNFRTLKKGLATGQILDVNWPELGVTAEQMLIETINTRDEGNTLLWYTVKCISGLDIGNWLEFWRSLNPQASFDFGGSDTLPVSRTAVDMVLLEDEVTAISAATETNWDEGNWDQMEWQ